jgi:hypothetical protein
MVIRHSESHLRRLFSKERAIRSNMSFRLAQHVTRLGASTSGVGVPCELQTKIDLLATSMGIQT